jgi:hypothetical protein
MDFDKDFDTDFDTDFHLASCDLSPAQIDV